MSLAYTSSRSFADPQSEMILLISHIFNGKYDSEIIVKYIAEQFDSLVYFYGYDSSTVWDTWYEFIQKIETESFSCTSRWAITSYNFDFLGALSILSVSSFPLFP